MQANKLLEKLKILNKSFYTLNDFEILANQPRSSVRIMLNRLTKRGLIRRLLKNIYILPDQIVDFEHLAEQIDNTSYLSFESVLSRYGILNQIPYAVTLATAKKSKTYDLEGQRIVFRKIKPELFGNYVLQDKLRIATPEKALLDMIYLNARGKTALSLEELDISIINKKELLRLVKKYPLNVRKAVASLVNQR